MRKRLYKVSSIESCEPKFGLCFFFASMRRHARWPRDWSSDVCSSDLTFRDGAFDQVVNIHSLYVLPVGLLQQLFGRRVHVQGVDVDDLVEGAVAERVAPSQVAVSEPEIRQVTRPALFFRDFDQRAVGIEPGDGESGLGERAREVAGPTRDLQHPDVATVA